MEGKQSVENFRPSIRPSVRPPRPPGRSVTPPTEGVNLSVLKFGKDKTRQREREREREEEALDLQDCRSALTAMIPSDYARKTLRSSDGGDACYGVIHLLCDQASDNGLAK